MGKHCRVRMPPAEGGKLRIPLENFENVVKE
jgi:hypothetical protein